MDASQQGLQQQFLWGHLSPCDPWGGRFLSLCNPGQGVSLHVICGAGGFLSLCNPGRGLSPCDPGWGVSLHVICEGSSLCVIGGGGACLLHACDPEWGDRQLSRSPSTTDPCPLHPQPSGSLPPRP